MTGEDATGGEVHLVRTMEAVAIPVFQFGIFSDVDLGFSAADDFAFGGRVHTNGNLFLAEANGTTLTLSDKVTAVKEVVRQRLSNGVTIDTVSQTGTVKMPFVAPASALSGADGGQRDGRSAERAERADVAHDVAQRLQQLDPEHATGARR